ncbi:MAG: hypothetical protein N2688_00450 [Burkholderiaceae bacterium]|nr:hypothetical protein [Burkholderiaceae bacterium]
MSFWAAGFWAPGFWADGFWAGQGVAPTWSRPRPLHAVNPLAWRALRAAHVADQAQLQATVVNPQAVDAAQPPAQTVLPAQLEPLPDAVPATAAARPQRIGASSPPRTVTIQ